MSDKVSTIALRAIACDIEDCEQPQSWADAMRAAVSEIEKLRAALKEAARVAQSYDQGGDYGATARHISANILAIMEIGSAALGEKE
jgi:hypothetical protein